MSQTCGRIVEVGGIVIAGSGPLDDVSANVSRGTPVASIGTTTTIVNGMGALANLSFRLWAQDTPPSPSLTKFARSK